MTRAQEIHVVLGAGQIGVRLASHLAARGHLVRLVARSARAAPAGVTLVQADATDVGALAAAADGARALYSCTNVPYERWQAELPPLYAGALGAARATGARLVVLDNLYAFGRMGGAPMRAGAEERPCSRKGALRKRLADAMLAAHARGEAEVALARASDFVGPGVTVAHLGERFFRRVFAGKAGECFGDPTLPHAFTYVDDVVATLAALGAAPRVTGRVWHVPTGPARSMEAWCVDFSRALGLPVRVKPVPGPVLFALGLFAPTIRELRELRYQWEEPYLVDDADTRAALGLAPTPLDAQVQRTAAWARATFGGADVGGRGGRGAGRDPDAGRAPDAGHAPEAGRGADADRAPPAEAAPRA
jgi:nucleoside-diphosphate-sugar epimerase